MSYLNKMYGRTSPGPQPTVEKNPNRVSGGLRAQGVDTLTILSEDGFEKEIPSKRYVQTLVTGPGDPLEETFYFSPSNYTIWLLKNSG